MMSSRLEDETWTWPCTRSEITAGLRRHYADKSLTLTRVERMPMAARRPSIGRIRGLMAHFRRSGKPGSLPLVLKEPRGTTRAGLAGVGRREVGVYVALSPLLPVQTPELIAASAGGDWLLLRAENEVRPPEGWTAEDYGLAVDNLVDLHDRFWRLDEDLEAFPWLARPLQADFNVHVAAAAQAIGRMVQSGRPETLAGSPWRMRLMAQLTTQADRVAEPLVQAPKTLMHGDYWPGNIALLDDGQQVVYDWQMAGVGPGVIDLLTLVMKSRWALGDPPQLAADLTARYRSRLQLRTQFDWSDEEWARLWDHALMWQFLEEWIDVLAASPDAVLRSRADELDARWLQPVALAVDRRLPPA
jgi:hypothetical protein